MSGVTGAVIGTGIAAAGATVYSANKAAGATRDATNASIAEQDKALAQQAELSKPYRDLGESAMPMYEALLGISPPAAAAPAGPDPTNPNTWDPNNPPFIPAPGGNFHGMIGDVLGNTGGAMIPNPNYKPPTAPAAGTPGAAGATPNIAEALRATPGYQFTRDEGTRGILNAASLTGGVSGNTLTDLDRFNTGLADSTYETRLGDYARAVGTGQAAAAGQAQNVGNAAGNISSLISNQGNTIAGINANMGAGIAKTIGNVSDQLIENNTLSALRGQTTPSPVMSDTTWSDGSGYTYNLPGGP